MMAWSGAADFGLSLKGWMPLVGCPAESLAPDPGRRFDVDCYARNATAEPLVLPEIVTLPGEIDITNAESTGDALRAAFGPGVAVVIADMAGTGFADLSAVRCLLLASKQAAQADAELRLVIGSAAVLRVLQITGADQVLTIYPTLQAALTTPGLAEADEAPGGG
jgi:anti-sigma B factor antagonist